MVILIGFHRLLEVLQARLRSGRAWGGGFWGGGTSLGSVLTGACGETTGQEKEGEATEQAHVVLAGFELQPCPAVSSGMWTASQWTLPQSKGAALCTPLVFTNFSGGRGTSQLSGHWWWGRFSLCEPPTLPATREGALGTWAGPQQHLLGGLCWLFEIPW